MWLFFLSGWSSWLWVKWVGYEGNEVIWPYVCISICICKTLYYTRSYWQWVGEANRPSYDHLMFDCVFKYVHFLLFVCVFVYVHFLLFVCIFIYVHFLFVSLKLYIRALHWQWVGEVIRPSHDHLMGTSAPMEGALLLPRDNDDETYQCSVCIV